MFPRGRIFLNYIQLREAISEFFKHWNLLSKTNGKNIRCSYSYTPATKKLLSNSNNALSNSIRQSKASIVRCPFQLKWTLVDH